MYYVYILKSEFNSNIYIGSTEENIGKRVKLHNSGKVKSTKACRPWTLLEYRQCNTRAEAVKLELFLKTRQQKELLRRKYIGAVAK